VFTKALQLVAILFVAVAMAAGWAHLLELPNKIGLSREDYLTVQQIYRGWALLGIAVLGGLISTGLLAWLRRGAGPPFYFALLAAALIALSLVNFFWFTYPTNQATQNWTVLPEGWDHLRKQWEYSHAAGAILYFFALASLVLSVISAPASGADQKAGPLRR
jgi:hypothetical protein